MYKHANMSQMLSRRNFSIHTLTNFRKVNKIYLKLEPFQNFNKERNIIDFYRIIFCYRILLSIFILKIYPKIHSFIIYQLFRIKLQRSLFGTLQRLNLD